VTDREALLAAILANPDDDTVRLIYADKIEDLGEGDRAHFIRLSIQFFRERCKVCEVLDWHPRERIARQAEIFNSAVCTCSAEVEKIQKELHRAQRRIMDKPQQGFVWKRGFLESIVISAEWWLKNAPSLAWHPSQNRPIPLTAQPIREVTLTTVPDGPAIRVDGIGDATQRIIRHQAMESIATQMWPWIKFTLPELMYEHGLPSGVRMTTRFDAQNPVTDE
jgi:uncharacterized protein (TIGR02996 family)